MIGSKGVIAVEFLAKLGNSVVTWNSRSFAWFVSLDFVIN